MRAFSQLLDDLVYTRSRNTKLKLIGDYLKEVPDPDRGYGLGALTGTLDIPHVKPAAVRGLVEERIDPVLFYMSRDYVGDTAETVSLLWPKDTDEPPEVDDATLSISDAIDRLRSASKMDAPRTSIRLRVAGMPGRSPVCVPRMIHSAPPLLPFAKLDFNSNVTSGKPPKNPSPNARSCAGPRFTAPIVTSS